MKNALTEHLRTLTPFTFVATKDETSLLRLLAESLKKQIGEDSKRVRVVSTTSGGWVKLEEYLPRFKAENLSTLGAGVTMAPEVNSISSALAQALRDDPRDKVFFYIILDGERALRDEDVQRGVLDLATQRKADEHIAKNCIFVGFEANIPDKLKAHFEVVQDQAPGLAEIRAHLVYAGKQLRMEVPEGIETAFEGLTLMEIDRAICQSIIATSKMNSGRQIVPEFIQLYRASRKYQD